MDSNAAFSSLRKSCTLSSSSLITAVLSCGGCKDLNKSKNASSSIHPLFSKANMDSAVPNPEFSHRFAMALWNNFTVGSSTMTSPLYSFDRSTTLFKFLAFTCKGVGIILLCCLSDFASSNAANAAGISSRGTLRHKKSNTCANRFVCDTLIFCARKACLIFFAFSSSSSSSSSSSCSSSLSSSGCASIAFCTHFSENPFSTARSNTRLSRFFFSLTFFKRFCACSRSLSACRKAFFACFSCFLINSTASTLELPLLTSPLLLLLLLIKPLGTACTLALDKSAAFRSSSSAFIRSSRPFVVVVSFAFFFFFSRISLTCFAILSCTVSSASKVATSDTASFIVFAKEGVVVLLEEEDGIIPNPSVSKSSSSFSSPRHPRNAIVSSFSSLFVSLDLFFVFFISSSFKPSFIIIFTALFMISIVPPPPPEETAHPFVNVAFFGFCGFLRPISGFVCEFIVNSSFFIARYEWFFLIF
mmetsp:Transcript_2598/g.8309  ORF Transcript_2598/g.8309 Transcript_2598/m.8309 type:complete len:473 (+) Transcript_2598:1017-2435(+)